MTTDINSMSREVDCLLDSGKSRQAVSLLKQIAKAGDAWGQYMLGLAYHYGNGVARSRRQAERWYQAAAEQNYDSAILNIGLLRAASRPPRYAEAFSLFRRAAKLGNRTAMYNLGLYYELGRHVKANRCTSFRWYLKSAELGDTDAQCCAGYCYHEGFGVRKNEEQAVHWYRKAAQQENVSACYNLGLCYLKGTGVKKSQKLAREWLERAAKLGHGLSYQTLEEMLF
ncbi:MAG: sel1 repeat family protein [Planctomycetaceae bacterium]|nr:sel1 repeat family protein [Planctomycetaceae bacterium]